MTSNEQSPNSESVMHIKYELVLAALVALGTAMFAFAQVQVQLVSLQNWKEQSQQSTLSQKDFEKERAILLAEIEKTQTEIQVLCRYVREVSRTIKQPEPDCPITYRAQITPR